MKRKVEGPGIVNARVSMAAKVIRVDGSIEKLETQVENPTIELNYEQCVEMFGEERANELFKGVERGIPTDGI